MRHHLLRLLHCEIKLKKKNTKKKKKNRRGGGSIGKNVQRKKTLLGDISFFSDVEKIFKRNTVYRQLFLLLT